jgi:hypothetical protein
VLFKFYFYFFKPRYRCFCVGLAKNHEKSFREMYKWSYRMLVSNALLAVYLAHQARFWSSWHVKKNRSSQFFDLGIENTLVRGTLAKFWTSLYVAYGSLTVYVRYHARYNIQFFVRCMYDRATYGLKKRPTDKYFRKMGFHKRYLLSPPLGGAKNVFFKFVWILLQGVFYPNEISGVGTIFGLLLHVLTGTNKQRARKPGAHLSWIWRQNN